MRLSWVLFFLLVAMCSSVVYVFTLQEVPDGHGFSHSKYETMQSGGDGAERHFSILRIAWWLGSLMIAFFVGLLALGMRRKGRLGRRKWAFLLGLGLYLAVFALMVSAYRGYAESETHALFLSFPGPSAWMLYALWPVPLYFVVTYMFFFDHWVLKEEDLKRFHQLVAARRDEQESP